MKTRYNGRENAAGRKTDERNNIMEKKLFIICKRITAIFLIACTLFTLVACGKSRCSIEGCENEVVKDSTFEESYCSKHLANKKALEFSKGIYASINVAYNICNDMGSDIVDAWRMGIYDEDKVMEQGVDYLARELSLSKEDLVYSVGYFTCTIFFGEEWTEETAKDTKENFSLETANAMFILADGTLYDMFQFCVLIVQDAYELNGSIEEARASLNIAKEQLQVLAERYPDFDQYSVLKDYYLLTSEFLEFCIETNGAFEHVQTTVNNYKDQARKYMNELEFTMATKAESTEALAAETTPSEATESLHSHTYGAWTEIKAPTCTTGGEKSRTCACGDKEIVFVSEKGHTMTNGSCTSCGLKESQGLKFTLNSDGKSYSVTGIGTCKDNDLVIPSKYNNLSVTSIGKEAFLKCTSLTSVTIPSSVTSIEYGAFDRCSGITSVIMFNGIKSIGDGAFMGCAKLTSVTIPESVTSMGEGAFIECAKLTSITIPDGVANINKFTFMQCTNLTSVTIGNGVTRLGEMAFYGCTSLKNVTLGNSVKSIDSQAFNFCTSLKDVYFTGTEKQWKEISIGSSNSKLTNATIHYNSSN